MKLVAMLFIMFFCLNAFSFQAFNGNTSLDIFNKIKCGDGVDCSKEKDKLLMEVNLSGLTFPNTAAAAGALTIADCGKTFVSAAAVELDLFDASLAIGCEIKFIVGAVANFTVDPATGDTILPLTNAAGDSLIADAIGETLILRSIAANTWAVVSASGTWTDSN